MTIEKRYCPHCGTRVYQKDETEFGIFCPKCHNDFWWSETLPPNYKKKGLSTLNELLVEAKSRR